METQIEVRLPAEPGSAAKARHTLRPLADGVPDEKLAELELLVSELVTNSIRHAGLTDTSLVSLSVRVVDHRARVEVCDPGRGFEPRSRPTDPHTVDGWGLFLVEQLADRWGVRGRSPTCVWFEIGLD